MKPQFMRWQPTTCDCNVLEYKDENGNIRIITDMAEAQALHKEIFNNFPDTTRHPDKEPQRPNKVCSAHNILGPTKDLYDVMNDECKRCAEVHVAFGRNSCEFVFEGVGKDRILKVSTDASQPKKKEIQDLLDLKLGIGKIEIL